jgi:hypothetical protein
MCLWQTHTRIALFAWSISAYKNFERQVFFRPRGKSPVKLRNTRAEQFQRLPVAWTEHLCTVILMYMTLGSVAQGTKTIYGLRIKALTRAPQYKCSVD